MDIGRQIQQWNRDSNTPTHMEINMLTAGTVNHWGKDEF